MSFELSLVLIRYRCKTQSTCDIVYGLCARVRPVLIDSFCIEGKERRAGDEQENMGANVEVAETIVLEPYGQVVVKMSCKSFKKHCEV